MAISITCDRCYTSNSLVHRDYVVWCNDDFKISTYNVLRKDLCNDCIQDLKSVVEKFLDETP